MENMAIDFEEERIHKKVSAIRLAREAVSYVQKMKPSQPPIIDDDKQFNRVNE